MSEEEAIKLLKEEPDYSLSYYKREYAIDIVLKENERLHSIIKEVREYIVGYIISDEDAKRDLRLGVSYSVEVGSDELGKLLEILDKVGEE